MRYTTTDGPSKDLNAIQDGSLGDIMGIAALRAKRRETLAQLDTLLQSTFLDMFGDPVTNPKGWKTKKGSEICKRITVGIVVKPASYYQETGIPALRSLNVRANKIETNNLVYISNEDNENKSVTTGKAGGLTDCEPLKAVYSTDSLTTFRWSTT